MARSRKKIAIDPAAAGSWKGRWIRDGYENSFGLIVDSQEKGEEIILRARFLDGHKDREISLEPRGDGEFLCPNEVRARYRPVSEDEVRAHLRSRKD